MFIGRPGIAQAQARMTQIRGVGAVGPALRVVAAVAVACLCGCASVSTASSPGVGASPGNGMPSSDSLTAEKSSAMSAAQQSLSSTATRSKTPGCCPISEPPGPAPLVSGIVKAQSNGFSPETFKASNVYFGKIAGIWYSVYAGTTNIGESANARLNPATGEPGMRVVVGSGAAAGPATIYPNITATGSFKISSVDGHLVHVVDDSGARYVFDLIDLRFK